MGGDLESWERNETLEQMRVHGTDSVRGWMYTTPELTPEMTDSIASQLCEKYDLCRHCGQAGHFTSKCRSTSNIADESGQEEETSDEEESGSSGPEEEDGGLSDDAY